MAQVTQVTEISVDKLVLSKFNVRKSVGDISELVESISLKGVIQPIVVRPAANKFEVVIGSRRFAAAKQCKLPTMPAIVKEMDDREALVESLTENLQRNNLEPRDLGEAVHLLRTQFDFTEAKIARELGLARSRISQITTAYQLLIKLEESGRRVEFYPRKEAREEGKAIPFEHTYMVASAFENPDVQQVLRKLPEEKVEAKKVELAEAVAPLREAEAKKVVDRFKMYPEESIEEVKKKALAEETGVAFETYLRPTAARVIHEQAEKEGKSFAEKATELLEGSIAAERVETREPVKFGGVELPQDPLSVQIHNKMMWNLTRTALKFDFYTVGYSETPDVSRFIERLKEKNVKTVIDIRHDPVSQFKPEFTKDNLARALKRAGIGYVHHAELGVPRDVRTKVGKLEDYDDLWRWYDRNVVPKLETVVDGGRLKALDKPYAFMCVELDPTRCHRHRIAKALERKGLKSLDL